jgi:hypothetical protein
VVVVIRREPEALQFIHDAEVPPSMSLSTRPRNAMSNAARKHAYSILILFIHLAKIFPKTLSPSS